MAQKENITKYTKPYLEVIDFGYDDVIATSLCDRDRCTGADLCSRVGCTGCDQGNELFTISLGERV